ncbi:MAG: NAD(+) synthase [Bacteroidales bacterium]|nr:NAD(+) synthase [Bacteroidales bacterium]
MVSGFLKVAAAVPGLRIADCQYNVQQIIDRMAAAEDDGVALCVLPELCITGYTCGDLFGQPYFIAAAESALDDILSLSHTMKVMAVVGMPIHIDGRLFNCAVVIREGQIFGAVPKTYLPNYNEFYEARWFTSARELPHGKTIKLCGQDVPIDTNLLFRSGEVCFGIEICEDMWSPIPPSSYLALAGANVILNLSASNDMVGKHAYRTDLVKGQSARCIAAYVYSSSGFGESTTDIVFAGAAMIAENGTLLAQSNRFSMTPQNVVTEIDIDKLQSQRLRVNTFRNHSDNVEHKYTTIEVELNTEHSEEEISRTFDPHPFIPSDDRKMAENCAEIFNIQTNGLAQRYLASHSRCAVVGISGGLDSTLALLVAVKTMDKLNLPRKQIIGVTMPGFGTTDRTYNNAVGLIKSLGAEFRAVSIRSACEHHFKDIGLPANARSVTYENSQARERTQILMDIANKEGGIVIGTGDLSELALGWATYNGDHMSMYGVNGGVPKTLVRYLVQFVADNGVDEATRKILLDIIDTPISPELLPADKNGNIAQKTENLVGPYELHDFYLYNFVRFGYSPKRLIFMALRAFDGKYSEEVAAKWLKVFFKRFFAQQFKRSALPDGPKVGSVSLSPRGDWRMPSDASANLWLSQLQDD